jgi:hypothetical protein
MKDKLTESHFNFGVRHEKYETERRVIGLDAENRVIAG